MAESASLIWQWVVTFSVARMAAVWKNWYVYLLSLLIIGTRPFSLGVVVHDATYYSANNMNTNSTQFPAVQFRIARPTDKLAQVVEFYEEGLGLRKLYSFAEHEEYDGVMLGLPNAQYHLEFTTHKSGSPCPAPTKDNLLVLYIPELEKIAEIKNRLASLGYPEVEPENPYWKGKSVTIEDPDGWRVVLFNGKFEIE